MKKELNLTGLEIFQLINSYKCSQIELEGMCFKKSNTYPNSKR